VEMEIEHFQRKFREKLKKEKVTMTTERIEENKEKNTCTIRRNGDYQ
jgi:hypothetical protein